MEKNRNRICSDTDKGFLAMLLAMVFCKITVQFTSLELKGT